MTRTTEPVPDARFRIALAGASVAYLAALAFRRDAVPPGLNNDAAEKALMGIELLDAGRLVALTDSIGNSAETLFLYLVAAFERGLGPVPLAIQASGWLVATAAFVTCAVWLRRSVPACGAAIAILLPAGSLWLFHYGRSGIRAVTSPWLAAMFAIALLAAERSPRHWRYASAGALLGLSLYGYTTCRVLPIAFGVYVVARLLGAGAGRRGPLLRGYGVATLAFGVVSIPNVVALVGDPAGFLGRGAYVVPESGRLANVAATLGAAWYQPEAFRALAGPGHLFDGVSATLTSAGFSALHPLVSIGVAAGVVVAIRRRRDPAVLFAAATWVCTVAAIGVAGPSLTRLLMLLPFWLTFCAIAIVAGRDRLPERHRAAAGVAVAVGIAIVGALDARAYFRDVPRVDAIAEYYGSRTTTLGLRAVELADEGARVACVVTQQANVVRYLTHDTPGVTVVEFYHRPFDPAEVLAEPRPEVLLVEAAPGWEGVLPMLPAWSVETAADGYAELRRSR